jgi:hypothetical protein
MNDQFDFVIKTPLPAHSINRAKNFLLELDDFAARLQPSGSPRLLSTHLQLLLAGGADADGGYDLLIKMQEQYGAPGYSMTGVDVQNLITCVVLTAAHLGVHALQAVTQEDSSDYLADARYLRGYADGLVWAGDDALVISAMGRMGAKVSNSIFEPNKRLVFEWCEKNFSEGQSIDSAARAAMLVGGVSFVTTQKYIKAWKQTRDVAKKPINHR